MRRKACASIEIIGAPPLGLNTVGPIPAHDAQRIVDSLNSLYEHGLNILEWALLEGDKKAAREYINKLFEPAGRAVGRPPLLAGAPRSPRDWARKAEQRSAELRAEGCDTRKADRQATAEVAKGAPVEVETVRKHLRAYRRGKLGY